MTGSAKETSGFWARFARHRPATVGIFCIVSIALASVLGYLIVPDSSPHANYQYPELALKAPGLKVGMLAVPRTPEPKRSSLLERMLFGQTPIYHFIPIQEHFFRGDSVIAVRDRGDQRDTIGWPLLTFRDHGMSVGMPISEAERESLKSVVSTRHLLVKHFPLGTDKFGRCFLSRLVIGARVSMIVGLIAVVISLTIGLFLGALAGYMGGRTDDLIMLLINAVWSIPTILLVFAIVLSLGRHAWNVYLAVGLTMWVDVARLVRGQVIDLQSRAFVEAGTSMGFKGARILIRHILPNTIGPLLVITAANFAMAILIEAGLSYLGFGIQPPQPSWGNLLNEHYGYALSGHLHLALVPALSIMVLVLAFNLVGNGLRDTMDVKRK